MHMLVKRPGAALGASAARTRRGERSLRAGDVANDADTTVTLELSDEVHLVIVDMLAEILESGHHDRHVSGVGGQQDTSDAGMRDDHIRRRELREHLRKRHEGSGASDARRRARGTMLNDELIRG